MKQYTILSLLIIISIIILTGCTTKPINEIKNEEYIGQDVTIQGTVTQSIKLGSLSGFIIEDKKGDSISVASESVPATGEELRVSGTLMRDSIFGYYIKMDE